MSYEGVRFGYDTQKTNSVRILGATIWVEKKSWKFFHAVFLQVCYFSVEYFNSCKFSQGRLKACEIISSEKFLCEKS